MRAPLSASASRNVGVVGLRPPLAGRGRGIRRIDPGHHAERGRKVVDAARHRTRGIEAERQGDDAVAAEQPQSGLETGDPVGARRPAHRPARVGAEAEHRKPRGDGDASAARRPRRRAQQVVRVERLPPDRAERRARRELRKVHLRQDNRARRPQFPHHERIVWRDGSFQQYRAAGCGKIRRVEVVLENDRDTMQGRSRSLGLAFGIKGTGRLQRIGISVSTACSVGPLRSNASMRARKRCTSCSDVSVPALNAALRSAIVAWSSSSDRAAWVAGASAEVRTARATAAASRGRESMGHGSRIANTAVRPCA